jgi:peptidoglycan/xylan/chitin deacetylase (PgdA/CDA1 family)
MKKRSHSSVSFVVKIFITLAAIGLLALLSIFVLRLSNFGLRRSVPKFLQPKPINGMIMLIEFESIDGILQWEKELDSRNITALVKVQNNVLEEHPEVFRRLAEKGYEIAGGYDEAPFWDMSYEEQYRLLRESQELVEHITGKRMRVFGSRYFAYDENTLKAADDLGIDYILARGTQDVASVIYDPLEYNVHIISVTNVENGEMGRGSLCDYSLWARGAGADEFAAILEESINKKPDNMILVSHAYLGGTRLEWWEEYRKILESDRVHWVGFDEWLAAQDVITMANADIPFNDEVKYVQPKPVMDMDKYVPIPGIAEDELVMFHNGVGEMCLDALAFFAENNLPVKEYLSSEPNFHQLLAKYREKYPVSEGVSDSYQYLPIIFYHGKAYSGFDDEVRAQILSD